MNWLSRCRLMLLKIETQVRLLNIQKKRAALSFKGKFRHGHEFVIKRLRYVTLSICCVRSMWHLCSQFNWKINLDGIAICESSSWKPSAGFLHTFLQTSKKALNLCDSYSVSKKFWTQHKVALLQEHETIWLKCCKERLRLIHHAQGRRWESIKMIKSFRASSSTLTTIKSDSELMIAFLTLSFSDKIWPKRDERCSFSQTCMCSHQNIE